MRIIVFATQKGGCGKSTLAINLALAAQEAGERVAILDLDLRKSVLRWASKRASRDPPARSVPLPRLNGMLSGLAKRGTSLVVIDTPPIESQISLAAIKAADFCIVPARPALFDIWASEVTARKLKLMDRNFAFLLNQCPSKHNDAAMKCAIHALTAAGPLLSPFIRTRADFLDASRMGRGVTEIHPKGPAAREIRALWSEIDRRLRPSRAHLPGKTLSRRSSS